MLTSGEDSKTSSVSTAGNISISPEEMTAIVKQLDEIMTELQSNALPAIETLKNLEFYKEGKAIEAIQAYPEAINKFMELSDNYGRASTLVFDTLQTMIETDEQIAQRIIEALEV